MKVRKRALGVQRKEKKRDWMKRNKNFQENNTDKMNQKIIILFYI